MFVGVGDESPAGSDYATEEEREKRRGKTVAVTDIHLHVNSWVCVGVCGRLEEKLLFNKKVLFLL